MTPRPVVAKCIRKSRHKGKIPPGYVERECFNPECRVKVLVSPHTAKIPGVMPMCNPCADRAAAYFERPGGAGTEYVRNPELFAAGGPTSQTLSAEDFWEAQRQFGNVRKIPENPEDL